MSGNEHLTVLDSAKAQDSLSVAKARHLVRTYMLQEVLEALHMIGMNPAERTADRNAALIFLAKFAEGEGADEKFAAKLTPKEAQFIARLGTNGINRRQKALPDPTPGREVPQNAAPGKRVDSSGADDSKGPGDPEGHR